MNQRMIKMQYVNLNNITQSVKLCMSVDTKLTLSKRHDLTDRNMLSLQQGMSQLLYLKEITDGTDADISNVSKNSPRK